MYQFDVQHAYDFARHIGGQTRIQHDELFFKWCPYCNPKRDRTNENSFSINLKTGQFKCLRASCGIKGNMVTLAKDFDFSLGTQFDEYYQQKRQYKRLKTPEQPIKPMSEAVTYLESRGISAEIAEQYEITARKDQPNILVFPFYDENGKLQFVKYRKRDFDKAKDKGKEWCEPNCKPILFGMKQCNLENKTLIMCEGQLDSLSVATADIENATSVPTGANGFTWIPYCFDWVNQFDVIIVFGDYENGKITLLDEISRRFKKTIKHVREEDYKDCKDANEILVRYGAEQVKKCIDNAVIVPMRQIIQLSDVEDVDIFKIPKLKTGIYQVDRLLYGGLPFGGVVLIGGKSGQGKSTLASQILVNAIEQNYKCFAYSGELPNYLFKSWIDFQAAGSRHVISYDNGWGDEQYKVSDSNKKLISEWYHDKCFLYDNAIVGDDERESLLTITENAIMQYGVQVILLDNLMTAIDLELALSSDKYERQSIFVKKLAQIALRRNVLILLVAHKRKNSMSSNENDEIIGASDITNLATITLNYGKHNDLDDSQRSLSVSKNRLFGRTTRKGYILNFDEKSRRIYGDGDDVNKDFGWTKLSPDEFVQQGFAEMQTKDTPFD